MSLLCFIWDAEGQVSLCRKTPQFLREFPSGFERDLHLRPPRAVGVEVPQQPISFFVCRHISQKVQGKSFINASLQKVKPHPIPLVKSCLQKAIRRGESEAAAAAAAYLIAHDPKEFLRRLPVVLAEEVGVVHDLPKVMWLSVAVQSGYEMQRDDIEFLLTLVAFATTYPARTAPAKYSSLGKRPEKVICSLFPLTPCEDVVNSAHLSSHTLLLVHSLILRACYGGMAGDVEMLLAFATTPEIWSTSVVQSVEGSVVGADMASPQQGLGSAQMIAQKYISDLLKDNLCWDKALECEHRLEIAVDMHCSDIVPQLLGYLRSRSLAGRVPTKEELEEIIWKYRSSINFRDKGSSVSISGVVPWWDHAVDVELSRLSREAWLPQNARPSSDTTSSETAKRRKTSNGGGRQLSLFRFAAAPPGPGGA